MKKRVAAAALWFYASWYATQMIAFMVGSTQGGDVVGPIAGAAVALLIFADPRRAIWPARSSRDPRDAPVAVPTRA